MPRFQITGTANIGVTDRINFGVTERVRSSIQLAPDNTGVYNTKGVPAFGATNVALSYNLPTGIEFYVNIRNLFDHLPPGITGSGANNGYAQVDDPTGRYFSAGVSAKF